MNDKKNYSSSENERLYRYYVSEELNIPLSNNKQRSYNNYLEECSLKQIKSNLKFITHIYPRYPDLLFENIIFFVIILSYQPEFKIKISDNIII